jgi:Cation transport ATPase
VVLWAGGFFFTRAWQSIVNRSLNMFTLIAVGVGAAYVYSAVAVSRPEFFPNPSGGMARSIFILKQQRSSRRWFC